MRALGIATAVVAAAAVAISAVVGIRSIPDLKRYLKMRHM